jgi:putative ABC transport system ATP-binding protein
MAHHLKAVGLAKRFGEGETAVDAVKGVDIKVDRAEFVAVMGESGSGKSTLLSMLGALNRPSSGTYLVDNVDIYALPSEARADFRRDQLGFVFQSFHLLPFLSAVENVMLPLATLPISRRQKRARAEEALARVGLRGKEARLPSEISGGEAERAAVARAIVNRPPLILADEPTGNLDSRTGRGVMELLAGLAREGTTVVMVTHSLECASFADRILQMSDGRIVREEFTAGSREELLSPAG